MRNLSSSCYVYRLNKHLLYILALIFIDFLLCIIIKSNNRNIYAKSNKKKAFFLNPKSTIFFTTSTVSEIGNFFFEQCIIYTI